LRIENFELKDGERGKIEKKGSKGQGFEGPREKD
jgi:hypothetical protein